MLIVDAHAHIFERWAGIVDGAPAASIDYGRILNGNRVVQVMPPAFEESSCSAENLLANMDCHGVAKAVIFSNGGYGSNNDFLATAVAKYPERLVALAMVDIPKAEQAALDVEKYMDAGFLGIKYEGLSAFACSKQYSLCDAALAPVWEACDSKGAILVAHLSREEDIGQVAELTVRYPHIRIVVAHFGAEAVFPHFETNWPRLLELVGSSDCIWLETSSITHYAGEHLFFDRSVSLIEQAVRAVGSKKVLWGSDYPCMTLYATYYQMTRLVTDACKNLREDEKEDIMGMNAEMLFFDK